MDQEIIGGFIANLRKENNLTQEELAEKLGVSPKSISRWENGKTMPDISMLNDLASILGVTVQELLNGQKMSKEELLELRDTIDNLILYETSYHIKKDMKTNKYIIMGNIILVVALMNQAFEILNYFCPENVVEFVDGALFGLGITLNLGGIYNNSHSISLCEKKKNFIKKLKSIHSK